jgi:hypothetical protein
MSVSQTSGHDAANTAWNPQITTAGAMAFTLVAAGLAIAWLLTQDLNALSPAGVLIWQARLLFANFLIIVFGLAAAASWLLVKNAREKHDLLNERQRLLAALELAGCATTPVMRAEIGQDAVLAAE